MKRFAVILSTLFVLSIVAASTALAHEPYGGYGGYGVGGGFYGGPLPGTGPYVPGRVSVGYRSVGGRAYGYTDYNNYGGYGCDNCNYGYNNVGYGYNNYGAYNNPYVGYGYPRPRVSFSFSTR